VLPFDRAAAAAYAHIRAERKRQGHSVPLEDVQIAAIALSERATSVATRNVGHFQGFGVPAIDPWTHR
jgi:predicted nucleic acid-binding protein